MGSIDEAIRTSPGIGPIEPERNVSTEKDANSARAVKAKAQQVLGGLYLGEGGYVELPIRWFSPEQPRDTRIVADPIGLIFEEVRTDSIPRSQEMYVINNDIVEVITGTSAERDFQLKNATQVLNVEQFDIVNFRLSQIPKTSGSEKL